MNKKNLKLKKFKFSEWLEDHLNWNIKEFSIGDFNVLLSDNAQGKTRLFNVLKFQKKIHLGAVQFNNPDYKGEATFWFEENEDEIFYKLIMAGNPKGEGLIFNEIVKRNEKVLFDRSKKILIEESNDKQLDNFFLPDNVPVVSTATDTEYITFNSLQNFFSRMLFFGANRFSGGTIAIDLDAKALTLDGANIGCVLNSWQEKKPLLFKEVINTFQDCFPFIEKVFIKEASIGVGMPKSPLMYIKERGVDKEIRQNEWSDGLLRALSHFAFASSQFQSETKELIRPSFLGIDEVENGLDYNTLGKVINHYESYSGLIQTVIATHSPLACNMVEANKWLVMRRKGVNVEVFSPPQVEDLESARHKIKKDNWEFYRRHIAKSNLYRIV